jgi:hypothetical protein
LELRLCLVWHPGDERLLYDEESLAIQVREVQAANAKRSDVCGIPSKPLIDGTGCPIVIPQSLNRPTVSKKEIGSGMSVKGKRRMKNIVEATIVGKPNLQPVSKQTLRSDASCILEALVAEIPEETVLEALAKQGFDADAYRSNFRALRKVARSRRSERLAAGE